MDLTCLRSHLEAQSLPDGWICTDSTSEDPLVLAKFSVDVHTLSANASLLVKVDKDFRWSVSCHGILVEVGRCDVLTAIPPLLNNVTVILDLLSTLQEVAVCHGNPVSDFRELVDIHGSEFKDSTGVK